jgi:hypothetical protein
MADRSESMVGWLDINLDQLSSDERMRLCEEVFDSLTAQELMSMRYIVEDKRKGKLDEARELIISVPNPLIEGHYFWLASQYYVTGRAAVFAGAAPVAGNLLHHAIEMFLKGDLAQHKSTEELKEYGHHLKKLWKAYKAKNPAVSLAAYNSVIKDLEKFEQIRYPDAFNSKGMFFNIPIVRPSGPPIQNWRAGGKTPPTYSVVLAEVDALVKAIFHAGSLNPQFEFMKLSSEGRDILHRANAAFPTPNKSCSQPPLGSVPLQH